MKPSSGLNLRDYPEIKTVAKEGAAGVRLNWNPPGVDILLCAQTDCKVSYKEAQTWQVEHKFSSTYSPINEE